MHMRMWILQCGWQTAKEVDERIRETLALVGMEERMRHMPGQMSGGEQQRVAIARAVAHRPKVVFADEPTGALDTESGLRVMQLFRNLIEKEGVTIVMTTNTRMIHWKIGKTTWRRRQIWRKLLL